MPSYVAKPKSKTSPATSETKAKKTGKTIKLTQRHQEVIRLLSLGCTVSQAAKILKLSPSTVDNHKTAAMARLGVDKLALVTRMAIKLGISSMEDTLTPAEKRKRGAK